MLHTPFIAKSYRQAGRLTRRSGSSFYRSFWLLPEAKRKAMYALYAFARITDDLGDCDQPPQRRTRWLHWWRQATDMNVVAGSLTREVQIPEMSALAGCPMDLRREAQQIFPALADVSRRYELPPHHFLEIIDGVLADQKKTRFDTYEQVEHYCYLSVSAVGLSCLHIWGFSGPMPTDRAIDCGLAFHLTNILRDVSEDARLGRIYLPRQHYEKHGLSEDDLLSPRPDDRLVCLIAEEAQRASRLFDSGWQVWDSLHQDGQPIFSMMWRTYRRLLQRIADDPSAVLTQRVGLSKAEKLRLATQHFVTPLFRRLPMPLTR